MNIAQGMPHITSDRSVRMEAFSRYVSILPWFNIDVLHKLYLNCFTSKTDQESTDEYRLRAITCADLMHSPYVKRIHYNVFIIEPIAQDQLRNAFMSERSEIEKIGQFMLAYASQCKQHFMSGKYIESYRIEGNLILNPTAEAERITQHIVHKINQQNNEGAKKNAVGYYLKILNRNKTTKEQDELINFLEGLQSYQKDGSKLPDEWQTLKSKNNDASTITIKLPSAIKSTILSQLEIRQKTNQTNLLTGLIIGIDHYQNEEIFSLVEAARDAETVYDYVIDNSKDVKKSKIRLLTNKDATRNNIIKQIESLAEDSKTGDTFLFYFAGYGAIEGTYDPTKNYKATKIDQGVHREERIILPYDFSTNVPGIALSEINYLLNQFPKDTTCIAIMDCSYNRAEKLTFEKNISNNDILIRSLPWNETERMQHQFIYEDIVAGGGVPSNFNGIIINAVSDTGDAIETFAGGVFTSHLLNSLLSSGNNETYEYYVKKEYNAEAGEPKWPSYTITGSFNINEPFLNGHLKRTEKDHHKIIANCIEKKQSVLNLSNLALTSFPKKILKIEHLETLILSGNQIKFIPVALKDMPNLKSIDFSNNPILHLPKSLHKAPFEDFKKYFKNELLPKSNTPCALLTGLDYEEKLPHVLREIAEVNELLSANNVTVFQLISPVAEDLFNFIYQHQNNLKIFHFAAFKLNQIKGIDNEMVELINEDWVEMFSCIRQTPFANAFAFLNCCDSRELMIFLSEKTIPRGIALPDLVDDELAYQVAIEFYQQLVSGKDLEESFDETRIKFAD